MNLKVHVCLHQKGKWWSVYVRTGNSTTVYTEGTQYISIYHELKIWEILPLIDM